MTTKSMVNRTVFEDHETGEVRTEERRFVMEVEKNAEFAMFFGEKIGDYLRLNNQQKNVLAVLSLNMELSTNVVFITAPRRKEWSAQIGISVQAFNNALSRLMESRVIDKQGNGQYMVDPALYSRSNFADRLRSKEVFMLKLMFEVDTTEGCSVKGAGVEVEAQDVYERRVKADRMEIDLETGKPQFKNRGKPVSY